MSDKVRLSLSEKMLLLFYSLLVPFYILSYQTVIGSDWGQVISQKTGRYFISGWGHTAPFGILVVASVLIVLLLGVIVCTLMEWIRLRNSNVRDP